MPNNSLYQRLGEHFRAQGIVRVMRHGDYARFILSSWVFTIGFWIQRIALGWLTWELTESGAWLGALAMAHSLPAIALTPFAGAIADRMDRVRLLRTTQGSQIIVAATLAALALAGLINAWAILVLAFLLGSIESMATPARMTIAPNLVPKEDLSGAIALTAVSFNSATFIGPAFAGLAIAGIGAGWTFAIAAIAFTPHYLVLRRLKLSESEHVSGGGRSLVTDIYEALRYLFGHKGIAPILILALAGGVLVRHLPELMPGFAGDVFKGGPETLGALMSSFGVGGMCGSLWIANRNRIQGTTTIFFLGFIGNAAFVFAFAVTGHILIGMMAVAMFGFSMSTSGNCAQILIQSAVQGSMRARAMSLYSLTFRGAPALGAMLFGAFSVIYGLQAPVAIGASVSFILGSVIFLKYRARIRQLMETRTEDT